MVRAEFVGADFVRGRICQGPSLLGAEMSSSPDKYPYPHDRRADKDSYPHDRNVTDDLCSLIKLCFAFIMVNFSS